MYILDPVHHHAFSICLVIDVVELLHVTLKVNPVTGLIFRLSEQHEVVLSLSVLGESSKIHAHHVRTIAYHIWHKALAVENFVAICQSHSYLPTVFILVDLLCKAANPPMFFHQNILEQQAIKISTTKVIP